MKIAISAKGKNSISMIDDRFGRCEYFVIYNSDDDSIEAIENSARNEAGGAGGKAVKLLSQQKVDIALVPELGPKAKDAIVAFGIAAFKIKDCSTVQEAITKYKNGELQKLNASTVAEHFGI